MPESTNEIIVYQPDETIRLEVRLENETVWLNRHQLAQLFGRDVKTIGKHIANALQEELAAVSTVANFATVETTRNPVVAKIATTATDGRYIRLNTTILTSFSPLAIASNPPRAFCFVAGQMMS